MKRTGLMLVFTVILGCTRATTQTNLPAQRAAPAPAIPIGSSGPKPQVLSFKVISSEGTYDAAAARQNGGPPRGVVTNPRVKLHATVQNAEAVRFVISSVVSKDGPIEQLGAFTPDVSGNVEVDWQLSRPGFTYIISALALRRPAAPPTQGDMVDSMGNLAGTSSAVILELAASK